MADALFRKRASTIRTKTKRARCAKEHANDYRYFLSPDLLPVVIQEETIERIRQSLPELPEAKEIPVYLRLWPD